MSNSPLPIIGTTRAKALSTSRTPIYTVDRPRFCAVIVPQNGSGAYIVDDIEAFETKKSDNGDAGTWSLTIPLLAAVQTLTGGDASQATAAFSGTLAGDISRMDLVAIYASRNSTDASGAPVPGTWLKLGPPDGVVDNVAYGAAGAASTFALGGAAAPSCLMIGFVDGHKESQSEETASATLEIWGRDLTKILIENDCAVPQMDPAGGQGGYFLQISNIVINNTDSGWTMLLRVLDAFVAKDPSTLAAASSESVAGFKSIAQYGYPWRNFIRTDLEDDKFRHIPPGVSALYPAAGGGSTWANLKALQNAPLTRLYVDEIGRLTFDDAFSAWGFGVTPNPVVGVITRDLIRERDFTIDDSDLVTALGILLQQHTGATVDIVHALQVGTIQSNPSALVAKFGFRYLEFTSQWDPPDSLLGFVQATRSPVILADHNDCWKAEITVKGDPRYRVGLRFLLQGIDVAHNDLSLMRTTGMAWYVTECTHSGQYGQDYSTKLTLRFSSASLAPPTPQVSGDPTGGLPGNFNA